LSQEYVLRFTGTSELYEQPSGALYQYVSANDDIKLHWLCGTFYNWVGYPYSQSDYQLALMDDSSLSGMPGSRGAFFFSNSRTSSNEVLSASWFFAMIGTSISGTCSGQATSLSNWTGTRQSPPRFNQVMFARVRKNYTNYFEEVGGRGGIAYVCDISVAKA
jgi:hypothetical protein